MDEPLECLIIGGGPAGLTAALYLGRFRRRVRLIDSGSSRAAWIPASHNIPFFSEGIAGGDILERMRENARRYSVALERGAITTIQRRAGYFQAQVTLADEGVRELCARRVLLAAGAEDVEPDLPDLPDAVRRGLVRYCPICDGYEARNRSIAVIGRGARGLGEAVFIARTYSRNVTLLSLGQELDLGAEERTRAVEHGVRIVESPIATLQVEGDRIVALRDCDGRAFRFDVLYSALGLRCRSDLARGLGARHDLSGALLVDEHCQTSIRGLYAAGAVVRGLDQIVVAMGHGAVAATHIHNRCEIPTEEEPEPVIWPDK